MAVGARHYGDIRAAAVGLAGAGRDRAATGSTTGRRPSPAACASACRSPATWSASRGWSSWTSRPAASTCRCRRACSTCCAAWWRRCTSSAVLVTHDLGVARLLTHRLMVMQGGARRRGRPDRPGARRSAARLHPDARRLDPAGMIQDACPRSASPASPNPSSCTPRATWRCRCCATWRSPSRRASAWRWSVPSGAGKSTLLRSLYGNYRADAGSIRVRHDGAWVELVRRRAARPCSTCAAAPWASSASSCA